MQPNLVPEKMQQTIFLVKAAATYWGGVKLLKWCFWKGLMVSLGHFFMKPWRVFWNGRKTSRRQLCSVCATFDPNFWQRIRKTAAILSWWGEPDSIILEKKELESLGNHDSPQSCLNIHINKEWIFRYRFWWSTDTLPGMNPHCSTAVLGFPRDGLMHQLGIWVVHLYKYLLGSALSPFPSGQLSANFELFLALISYDRSFHSDNVLLYTL